jgi:hypothetical protein
VRVAWARAVALLDPATKLQEQHRRLPRLLERSERPKPLQTPTRHLLIVFAAAPDEIQIGAEITTTGDESLAPGGTYSVQLAFWAPEAEDTLTHRKEFNLWAGRTAGSGRLSDQP